MTNFGQDTDSHPGQDSSSDIPVRIELRDVTTGTSEGARSLSFLGESNPVRKARTVIPQIENTAVAEQLDKLLLMIRKMIEIAQRERPDLRDIPPLLAHIDEDGAVLVEWIFPDFRVGFNIEPNPNESGWYLVSNKKLNNFTVSGQLGNMDAIIRTLLRFILPNI